MYTIIMNDDKSLTASIRKTLYQREKIADQIQFLIPQKIGIVNLNECIAILHYVDQGNVMHDEKMAKDSELYKDKIRFIVPVDSKLNYFAGDVSVRIVFAKLDTNTGKYEQVMISGNTVITIEPTDVTNSLDTCEKISILEKEIEYLKENQVDDLKLTDDLLQLSANGEPIGEGVTLPSGGEGGSSDSVYDEDGAPVIDMDNLSLKNDSNEIKPEEDSENKEVVEF